MNINTIRVDVMQSVYAKNEEMADALNAELTARGILCVNVLGSPGAGKTGVIARLAGYMPVAVIEGDIEGDIDARKFAELGIKSVQINTAGACHLDVPFVRRAFEQLGAASGFVFVENIGNLVCPAEFNIGEHVKMLVSNVAEGSDKPYKYPLAFEKADVILLNKIDLSPYVDFDEEYYTMGIKTVNKNAPIFRVSAKTGDGFEAVAEWLKCRIGR